MTSDAPLGIFDSGLGGLSVAREIRNELPAEQLLYVADTAYCPYGDRPPELIRERTLAIGRFLADRGAKLLVVACNSASGAALEALRATLTIPIVGMEPALKPAALASRTRRVGVLATAATLAAERFDRLMHAHAADVELVTQPCPGLVELVEQGETGGEAVGAALAPVLAPLRRAEVDIVVLGCTHYPFLRDAIREELGPGVQVIDSGAAVARQTGRILRERGLEAAGQGGIHIFTTGDPTAVRSPACRLWQEDVAVEGIDI